MGIKIALISPAGGGKDFIANYLVEGYGFTRYAFADNVKKVASQWFPDQYNSDNKPRALLQKLGTDFREINPEVWINAMFADIDREEDERKRLSLAKENVVVTDCRLPNEYAALKARGFKFVFISASEQIRLQRMIDRGDSFSEGDMSHHTESFYDSFKCDYYILNIGEAQDTYSQIDDLMDMIVDGVALEYAK